MQIMFGTILCVLLKSLILTKATNTPKVDITSNILQEENVSMYPDINFMQDISMSEKSDHHILNFKSDRSYSDSMTVRNELEVDEVPLANISIIPKSIESNPTSLRAFVQFDSQFTEKMNDIFVTLRWNQPEFTDEIIQGYTMQCFFIEDFKKIQICDDKNITTTKLEHTVHNLTSNTTYYFRVRAHTKVVVGPYTDLINVSTTHENPIPKLLVTSEEGIQILDMDLNITNFVMPKYVHNIAYSIQEHRIYWLSDTNLMTLKINENYITKIASYDNYLYNLCIDWVARNLYFTYNNDSDYPLIVIVLVKFDLTMWENGIIKFDEIYKTKNGIRYLNVLPSMGILYYVSYNWMNSEGDIIKYHLDKKIEQIEQIVRISVSSCLLHYIESVQDMIVDNMNNEEPLIYWLSRDRIFVTDTIVFMCNEILHKRDISDNILFETMTIAKTNIYILARDYSNEFSFYVLKKKYVSLKSVNAAEYVEKIIISLSGNKQFDKIHAFDQALQSYPPMRCLTPDEKVYNFENVNATTNSISVNLPEPVVKNGCKKYNLPTTIYTISVSCLDNNLNKSEKFNVLRYVTFERYYEIQNLTPCTEYKLKFTLSNFYFDELSINPFDSNVISIKTNSGISSTSGIIAKKYYLLFMLSFIVIVTIIFICYFYYLYRQSRGNNEQFLSSTTADVELAILHEIPCRNPQFNMIYSPMLHYNLDECAITKIAQNQITLTKHLGSGAFGMVYQGKVKDLEKSGTETSVAIKTLRKDATSHEKEKFLKEAKLMNHFQHKHILRLLAVCLDGDSPLLVLELMETGDLLKYLRECRNLQASDSLALRLQDLLAMCEDVARGCCYLEELRFIHRDLACRNCLVSSRNRENRVIKIGDFGLARDIYKDDYYHVKGEGLLPIRWMAPESLIMGIFTSQSDVWSFGILMWEITSLGEQPYSAKANEEVINYVRAGGRLPKTLNCPSPLYQLMLRCWSAANVRPNFKFCLENIIALRKNMEDALLSPVDTI
ncbi:proto-oncogene tyrosine-protein kinase ROS-like [Camponotus floridanus]|uniref:proto-oncogene tyrosine-protein kinase ROS-like n=1 Tax=Camponotus floridanus TaxID=104421 RepID=UPI000DC6AF3C|nr:proto-oncogene tyrosine-protein kinase ROS-like [Camponotus floridanus]